MVLRYNAPVMPTTRKYLNWWGLILVLAISGCSAFSPPAPDVPASPSPLTPTLPDTSTPSFPDTSTPSLLDTSTPALPDTPTPTLPPTSTPPPADTPTPTLPDTFPLQIPIPSGFRTTVDGSYRFATTQGGTRETHRGVEFLNSFGTPVLAAADGTVLFAGDDNNKSPYSPTGWYAFYGNFIVLDHGEYGDTGTSLYTLYGHLSEILVQEGDKVSAGQEIGLVGFSGAALGSHLHFEVRMGGTRYADVRNPEIYMQPQEGHGTLVGRIEDAANQLLKPIPLQLIQLDTGKVIYFSTYEKTDLAGQPPYFENFVLGDLPAGMYELSFMGYRLEEHILEILPGDITEVDIAVSSSSSGG